MTYTVTLDKLIDEIESRANHHAYRADIDRSPSEAGARDEDKEILSFIDSMQKEPVTSVWHDSNTVPVAPDKNHLWVVVSLKNGDIRTCFIDTLVTWQRVQREAIDCWAYREDLLKL